MGESATPPSDGEQEGHPPAQPAVPPAGPATPARLRPSRAWYWVALAVFLAGVGWLGGRVYMLAQQIDSFQRVAAPGSGEVSLDHSGGYVIYYEGPGAADGDVPAYDVNVTARSQSSAPMSLEAYSGSLTYSFGSREGRAVLTLEVAGPGTVLIEVADGGATPGDSSLAIGSSIAGDIVGIVVPAVVLMLVGVGGAIAVAIIRHRRRRVLRATGNF